MNYNINALIHHIKYRQRTVFWYRVDLEKISYGRFQILDI